MAASGMAVWGQVRGVGLILGHIQVAGLRQSPMTLVLALSTPVIGRVCRVSAGLELSLHGSQATQTGRSKHICMRPCAIGQS